MPFSVRQAKIRVAAWNGVFRPKLPEPLCFLVDFEICERCATGHWKTTLSTCNYPYGFVSRANWLCEGVGGRFQCRQKKAKYIRCLVFISGVVAVRSVCDWKVHVRDTGVLHQKSISASHKMQGNVHKGPHRQSCKRADSLHFPYTTIQPMIAVSQSTTRYW